MNQSSNLESLKLQVEQLRTGRSRVMWPESIRAQVRRLLSTGFTLTEIRNATGISFSALHSWQGRSKFKEVRVSEAPAVQLVTLRLSNKGIDVEIENLSTVSVVDILARLF